MQTPQEPLGVQVGGPAIAGSSPVRLESVRKSRRDSSDPRAERTLEKILNAVHDLARAGNRSITVADVTRQAGVGKTAFYSHFSGLGELSLYAFERSFGLKDRAENTAPLTGQDIVDLYAVDRALYATVVSVHLKSEIMSGGIRTLAERIGVARADGVDDASDLASRMITAAGIIGAMNAWLRDEISASEQDMVAWLDVLLANSPPVSECETS